MVRPVRPVVPLVSCAAVVLAWELVAHNSGAGWVQALGDGLAGVLLIGLVAPAVVVARARVALSDTPADGTAGLPVELPAAPTTRLRARPLSPPGPHAFVGPHRPAPGARRARRLAPASPVGDGEWLTVIPERRGVHTHVVVELSTAAPFGLLWWRRTVEVRLPRELAVGPRLGAPLPLGRGPDDMAGEEARRAPVQVGEPRGVRPYRPGDNRRWVHWPGTAHSGELMVREMEGPTTDPVTVEVRLPSDPDDAEREAERALGTVVALLDRGTPVMLSTMEAGGPRVGPVADRRTAGRRLARAVAEPGDAGTTVSHAAGRRP
jgi:uncharacterized protein (DUF58 family)